MSRARRVFAAFGIGIVNQALAAVLGLWVTRFSLHRIGPHDYGLWVIAGQVLAYMVLLDLGVLALLPREIAVAAGKLGDPEERDAELRDLFERSVSLVLLIVPLLVAGSLLVVGLLPAQWAPLRGPLAVHLALYVAVYPFRLVSAVLTGLQELTFLGWMQTLSFAVSCATTVTLVLFGFGLYALAIGAISGQIIAAFAATARLFLRHRRVVPRRFRWASLEVIRRHLSPGFWASLGQISHVFANATDVIVIGRMLGPDAVLRFSFTDKTENMLSVQPYSIGNLSGPALGELKGAGRQSELARLMGVIATATLMLSGAIVLAVLETNRAFVRVWLGDQYFGGMTLTVVILANMMARHWAFPYSVALFYYSGRVRATTLMVLADGVVSLGLSIVLVGRLGIVGAPLGSLLGALITEWPASVMLMARDSGSSPWAPLGPVWPWLVRFVPIAVVAAAAGVWLGGKPLILVACVGVVIGFVYVAAMLPLLRQPPLDVYAAPWLAKFPLLERVVRRNGS